jgi:hypothetical protein
MEGERVNVVEMLIHAFKEMLNGKNPSSVWIDQKHIILDLNEIETALQDNIYTPRYLETLLEQHGERDVSSTGAIFTPDNISRAMACYCIDAWLINSVTERLKGLKSNNTNTSLLSVLLDWGDALKNDIFDVLRYIFDDLLPNLRILDPCTGGGAFIIACALRLFNIYVLLYPYVLLDKNSADPKELLLNLNQWALIERETPSSCNKLALEVFMSMDQSEKDTLFRGYINNISKILHFIDINQNAIEITKIRLNSFLYTLSPNMKSQFYPDWNGMNGDALDSFQVNLIEEFDIIIANPPYIGADNLAKNVPKQVIDNWKQKFRSFLKRGGKPDLYFYFIAQAVKYLRKQGLFCFIIPNRILSNDYAQVLRQHLIDSGHILRIVDFSPSINVFPNANVHPCIVAWQKTPNSAPESYWAAHISNQEHLSALSLQASSIHQIDYRLLRRFSVFLSQITPEIQEILSLNVGFPPIRDMIEIHEGTRLARFQHKFPPDFEFRVPYKSWLSFPMNRKMKYLREIRGKNIQRYALGDIDSALSLPELLEQNHLDNWVSSRPSKNTTPIVYIRELGEKLYAAYEDNSEWGSVGYGGVYFFGIHDLSLNKIQETPTIEPYQCLLALCAYMCSDLFVFLYRALYAAGAWGTALKFRSSYLHQIPIIDFNWQLFYLLGKILHFLGKTGAKRNQSLIHYFEELINLILVGNLLNSTQNAEKSPISKNCSLTEEIRQILDRFIDPLVNLNSFNNAIILRIQETIEGQPKIGHLKMAIKSHPFWKSVVTNV